MGIPIQPSAPACPRPEAADEAARPVAVDDLKALHDQLAGQIDALCGQLVLRSNPSFIPAMPSLPSPSPSRIAVLAAIEGQRCRLDFLTQNTLVAHDAFCQMEQLTRDLVTAEIALPDSAFARPAAAASAAPPPPPVAPLALSDVSSDSAEAVDGEILPPHQRRSRLYLDRLSLVSQTDELLSLHRELVQRANRDYPRPILDLDASEAQIEADLRREGETLRHLGRLCHIAAEGFEGLERRRQGLMRPEATLRLSDLAEN